ncbi:MAG: hypothetical protein Q8O76_02480 [Chloroflexota bacterium]|nr:hypothetical protein [Chloroflexota bacterium]
MNRSEDGEVRQGSRIVTAATRQAMAREKARITGKRTRQPSALEQAAVEWQKEREARARKAEEERLGDCQQVEACPFSLQQVSLQVDGIEPPPDEADWEPYSPGRRKEEEKRTAITVTRRVNMAGVCALSRRLMALEWARALSRKPVDLRA